MKSKSNNPIIIFCVKNYWIASYMIIMGMFMIRIFPTQSASIVSIIISSTALILIIIALIFGRTMSKPEQKAENDERTQMIIQKASKWTMLAAIIGCLIISLVCMALDYLYTGLLVLGIAFFSQLLFEIFKAVFARKY